MQNSAHERPPKKPMQSRSSKEKNELEDASSRVNSTFLDKTQSPVDVEPMEIEERITSASQGLEKAEDLEKQKRTYAIVTTAALPWMTGTSVNPLLRAAYLGEHVKTGNVCLCVPWLPRCDQRQVFPKRQVFKNPEEQKRVMLAWVEERVGFIPKIEVLFYPGRYATDKGSIVPVGDIIARVPMRFRDVAILEEPEHLNWFHCGEKGWKECFKLVVGIIHTNYLEYARREEDGEKKERFIRGLNFLMAKIYTHKIIKLSDAVQDFENAVTVNVHGVSRAFLDVGKRRAEGEKNGFSRNCYFIAKVVWAKGYHELLDVIQAYNEYSKEELPVAVFGDGDDLWDVKAECQQRKIPLNFKGRLDHLDDSIDEFKIFINPSLSDVVATTTAEALAMGKFVICADHPSNEFFASFDNCKTYKNQDEFNQMMDECLKSEPNAMTEEARARLTWEAATSRLLDACEYPIKDLNNNSNSNSRKPNRIQRIMKCLGEMFWRTVHRRMTTIEAMRVICGGGAGTLKSPDDLVEWHPDYWCGGAFDRPPSVAQDLGLFADEE